MINAANESPIRGGSDSITTVFSAANESLLRGGSGHTTAASSPGINFISVAPAVSSAFGITAAAGFDGANGRAVQVDPIKPTLKAPKSKLLKLEHEKVLSNYAFKLKFRRYTTAPPTTSTSAGTTTTAT